MTEPAASIGPKDTVMPDNKDQIPEEKKDAPVKMGRPPMFTQEIADIICNRLADGESLRRICKDENMPSKTTVFKWLADERYVNFADQYARAREAQAESLVEECLDIADDSSNDYVEKENADGSKSVVVDKEHIARSKLRVDTRKWWAARLAPKKYGDRLSTEVTGKDGAPLSSAQVLIYEIPDNHRDDDTGENGDGV